MTENPQYLLYGRKIRQKDGIISGGFCKAKGFAKVLAKVFDLTEKGRDCNFAHDK